MKSYLFGFALLLCTLASTTSNAQTALTNRMDFYVDYPTCSKSIFGFTIHKHVALLSAEDQTYRVTGNITRTDNNRNECTYTADLALGNPGETVNCVNSENDVELRLTKGWFSSDIDVEAYLIKGSEKIRICG